MPHRARLGKARPRAGKRGTLGAETFDIQAGGQENFNILTLLSLLNCEWHNKRTG